MPLVFRTKPDSPDDFRVAGVPGLAGPQGKGGIVVDTAAETMLELQDSGKPKSGKALKKAAEQFAERYPHLVVEQVSDGVAERLPQELGAAPPRPPAAEVAIQGYNDLYGAEPEQTETTQGAKALAEEKE